MSNESVKSSFTLTFDSYTTHKRVVNTALVYQLDMWSSTGIISPTYWFAYHQTGARTGVANKANNRAIFCQLDVRKYFVEINGLLNPFINYTHMKKFYPIQVIDSRIQVDQKTPEKVQLFEE